ncbi:competence protein ComK [Bacillus sp. V3B]|nr:competence protein ComK [Bacillus sp. V3B]
MNKREVIEEYEINPMTLAILPVQYGGKLYSQIYQLDDDELYSPFKPLELIKRSCRLFASSYEGRKEGSRQLIGVTHKIPITIDSTNLMYFFPTISPKKSQCAWVSHEHVLHYEKVDSTNTLVIFRNKESVIIPISVYSFDNQMLRTALLRTKLMQRIGEYDRKTMIVYRNSSKASERKSTYGDIER